VALTREDSNTIKTIQTLGTSVDNTYVLLQASALGDMNKNPNLLHSTAMRAMVVIADVTSPKLQHCAVDMDAATITVTFDETMLVSSLQVTSVGLQNSLGSPTQWRTLTNGSVSTLDSHNLTVTMDEGDMNAIKVQTALAVDSTSTFVQFVLGSVGDMNNISLPLSVLNCGVFTADTTDPELLSFSLDMHSGRILMSFSESVEASSVSATELTLHNAASPTFSFTLTEGIVSLVDGTTISVNLSTSDMNLLKQREDMATGLGNTYLSLTAQALNDMNNNAVVAINALTPLQAQRFTDDRLAADLVEFDLNMDTALLTLVFSETMNVTSIDVSKIVLPISQKQSSRYI